MKRVAKKAGTPPVEERLAVLRGRVTTLEDRFETLVALPLDTIAAMRVDTADRFDRLDRRFDDMDRRFNEVDVRLSDLTDLVKGLTQTVEALGKRVDGGFAEITKRLDKPPDR